MDQILPKERTCPIVGPADDASPKEKVLAKMSDGPCNLTGEIPGQELGPLAPFTFLICITGLPRNPEVAKIQEDLQTVVPDVYITDSPEEVIE